MASNVDEMSDGIPVSVLTGFLGSGKTTLLGNLLRDPGMKDTAVIINEFGEIPLDHHLVKGVSGETVVMESGCVCCTIRSDLGEALRVLYQRRAKGEVSFKRVVIETTGMADPAPIIHLLMQDPIVEAYYRLDGVITTIDCVNGLWQLVTQPEAMKQVAVADRIVLTKADLAPPEQRIEVAQRIHMINPGAPLIQGQQGHVPAAALFNAGLYDPTTKSVDVQGWLREEAHAAAAKEAAAVQHAHDHEHGHDHDHDHGEISRHPQEVGSVCLTSSEPLDWDAFSGWMETLLSERGADVLRVKGILNIIGETQPVVIHGVQHLFHPPARLSEWPDEDHRSRIVFITRGIDRKILERGFAAVTDTPPAAAA